MINEKISKNKPKIYDLEERTAKFGEDVIDFCKLVPKNVITLPLIDQLIRSGTAVGAIYCEADCAESKRDFEHKLGICKKESKEAKYWTRMIARAIPELKERSRKFWQEANELNLIFTSIVKKSKANKGKKD